MFRDIIQQADSKPLHQEECEGSKLCRPEVTASDILGSMESWSEYASPELFLNVSKCLAELQKGNATYVPATKWTEETVEAGAGGTPFVSVPNTRQKQYSHMRIKYVLTW